MTSHQHSLPGLSTGTEYSALAERFRPIFSRIAQGALDRERARALPYEPIEWLKRSGFGAVRVPVEHGGSGASLTQLFQLLIELAEADSNIPQALRGHFAFVEDRLNAQCYKDIHSHMNVRILSQSNRLVYLGNALKRRFLQSLVLELQLCPSLGSCNEP